MMLSMKFSSSHVSKTLYAIPWMFFTTSVFFGHTYLQKQGKKTKTHKFNKTPPNPSPAKSTSKNRGPKPSPKSSQPRLAPRVWDVPRNNPQSAPHREAEANSAAPGTMDLVPWESTPPTKWRNVECTTNGIGRDLYDLTYFKKSSETYEKILNLESFFSMNQHENWRADYGSCMASIFNMPS